jgi:hypothetical protein
MFSLCVATLAIGRTWAEPPQAAASGLKAIGREQVSAPTYWAFRPPARPPLPKVAGVDSSVLNPIDRFLIADLRRNGLTYAPPADRRTLLRRVTYDLIGLPPTPEEVETFVSDRSPGAYEKVVDRLLADPRYGERWARHWLDTAGYADSEGILEEDRIRPNAWRYRDYVIRSLNADKPYDRFLREQIAGDELTDYRHAVQWTPEITEAITATGFLRTAVDATRDDFNTHQYAEYQYRMLNDTQTILVSSTLGLTLQCARCHDHKYEPLSQKDYYRMQAILAGAIRPQGALLPTNRRQIVAATAAEQQCAREIDARVTAAIKTIEGKEATLLAEFRLRMLDGKLNSVPDANRAPLALAAHTDEAMRTPQQKELATKYKSLIETPSDALASAFPEYKRRLAELQAASTDENKKRLTLNELRALYDQDATPLPTHVLIRGEWMRPGDTVEPGIPAILDDPRHPFIIPRPADGATTTGRRLALANWIARPDNPLTARVIVNRVWAHHFGVGLVASLDNFGRSGARPSNRVLLDWLACELTRGVSGSTPWTLKPLHRLIVLSAAYRQSSAYRTDAARIDPEDRLLWRQRPRRLEAEGIRDAILSVAGTLDPTMYGEPVNEETRATGEVAPVGDTAGGRRSIYLLVRRSRPVTLLNTFDAPIMETNCTRRVTSTTATQALALMNGEFMAAQSLHLAMSLLKEAATKSTVASAHPATTTELRPEIDHAYRLAFGRAPSAQELAATLAFLPEQTARYMKSGKPADAAREQALADVCLALMSANEFVYVD